MAARRARTRVPTFRRCSTGCWSRRLRRDTGSTAIAANLMANMRYERGDSCRTSFVHGLYWGAVAALLILILLSLTTCHAGCLGALAAHEMHRTGWDYHMRDCQ